ncbi:MAG: threonylcarbamoyl-AMP synthase [Clostridiales bacterium]|jgi:L-threonylcarbamoyladenylate synthase|nr:threonylcarbamoyl-AMP synthase [Clostridiales bacterium]
MNDISKKIIQPTEKNFQIAAECVRNGGVIIAPSDTNIALTLNPWDDEAIKRTFEIKNRPATSPLTLFFYETNLWVDYATSDDKKSVQLLINAFWPGPFNIILRKKDTVSDALVCGGDTIAMGCLKNPVWRGFMEKLKMPVAMTSANLSGKANGRLVNFDLAVEQVGEKVDYILRGESTGTTISSTIIDLTDEPTILRLGDISKKEIEDVINRECKIGN